VDRHGSQVGAGRLGRGAAALLSLPPLAFLAIFFVLPVTSIILEGLRPDGVWAFDSIGEVLSDPDLRGVIWFSAWQAALSTVLTLVVGLPIAYVLARFEFRGRGFVQAAVTVPFVLPTVVVGVAFLAVLGPDGPVSGVLGRWWGAAPADLRGTLAAILVAHVFFNVAVVVRVVGGLLESTDPRMEDAAASLGAGRWRTAWHVVLPLARPAIVSAAGIVFLFTFASFGVVLLLGGPQHSTLEVEIHRQTAQLLDLPVAAALSLIQLGIIGLLLAVGVDKQQDVVVEQTQASGGSGARRPQRLGERATVVAVLGVATFLLGVPLWMLVSRSFRASDGGWTVEWYRRLADPDSSVLNAPALDAVRNSLEFAVTATVVAVVVGLCASVVVTRGPRRWGQRLDLLLLLPLGVSAVTVGFGFLISLDQPPFDLRSSRLLIPMAQALVAIPFVVRIIVPSLASIDRRMREAAAVLGASPARVWREVDLPLVARSVAVAAGFAFALSLGEFGATVFIARAETVTVPVAILRLFGKPGAANIGQAMALATILMVMTTLSLLAISRLRPSASR
jgi:thiamine transport system permease protein